VGSHVVEVATPFPLTIDVPRTRKVGDNSLGCALGDFQQVGYVSDTNSRITGDQEKRIAVVCEQAKIWNGAQGIGRPLVWSG
jgi:hypothetical protein